MLEWVQIRGRRRAGETAQWVEELAAKPDGLKPIPRAMWWKESQVLQLIFYLYVPLPSLLQNK